MMVIWANHASDWWNSQSKAVIELETIKLLWKSFPLMIPRNSCDDSNTSEGIIAMQKKLYKNIS